MIGWFFANLSFKEEYCDKISRRGLSDLAMLPDAEFEAGCRKLRQWASENRASGPVVEPLDLFVFKKAEPAAAADSGPDPGVSAFQGSQRGRRC